MKVRPALHGHPDTGCLAYLGHTILYICQQREGEGGIRAVQNIWYFDGNFVFVFDTKFSKRQCWCKGNSLEGTPGWLSINYLDCPLVVRSHKSIAVLLLLILRKITNQLFSVLDIITIIHDIIFILKFIKKCKVCMHDRPELEWENIILSLCGPQGQFCLTTLSSIKY